MLKTSPAWNSSLASMGMRHLARNSCGTLSRCPQRIQLRSRRKSSLPAESPSKITRWREPFSLRSERIISSGVAYPCPTGFDTCQVPDTSRHSTVFSELMRSASTAPGVFKRMICSCPQRETASAPAITAAAASPNPLNAAKQATKWPKTKKNIKLRDGRNSMIKVGIRSW